MISKIKLVCRKLTSGITTQNIYKILLNEEFSIDETLTLKIEMKNQMLCLEKFVEVNKSKLLSQSVRSFSWKLFHNLLFVETEEARIRNRSPICSTCGETDIDQIHIYFRCPKLKGIGQILMKILKIFDPEFSEEEVLAFQLQTEFPQANWVTLNTLFYIYKSRKNISIEAFKSYLINAMETVRRSKFCDQDTEIAIDVLIEMIEV